CSYVVSPVAGKKGQVGGVSGQVAPVLTTGLLVNNAAAACGATVTTGAQVCLRFTSDQSGTAVILSRTGAGADTVLTSGSITAGKIGRASCRERAADGVTRTLTLTVTNAAGQTASQTCSYVVAVASGK